MANPVSGRLQLLIREDVQRILDVFCASFDIRILFYTAEGEMIRIGLHRPICRYCSLIQGKLYDVTRCLALDERKRAESARKRSLICYTCHAGLSEAIMPIYAKGQHLGFAMVGQVRTRKAILPSVRKEWHKRFKSMALEEAFDILPHIPSGKLEHILGLFALLMDYVVSKEMIEIAGDVAMGSMLSYMQQHISRPVTLEEVSAHVGKSKYTVSHLFPKTQGKTFKQALIEMKLEKADEYLRSIPGITIARAAEMVGFDDAFYFSRLYKRYRGFPPSRALRRTGT